MNLDQLEKKSKELQNNLSALQGQESLLAFQIDSNKVKLLELSHKREVFAKSIEIFALISEVTQQQVKEGFNKLITYILQYIFEQDYKFELEFGKRGNLQECNFKVISPDGVEITDTLDALGGGILDVLSFGLRLVLMELIKPRYEGFVCLDESFKHVSINYLPKIRALLKEINKRFDKQIILVTHQRELIDATNNYIELK
jgi:DNA repair exonuclease SbcCD ATPase subunit